MLNYRSFAIALIISLLALSSTPSYAVYDEWKYEILSPAMIYEFGVLMTTSPSKGLKYNNGQIYYYALEMPFNQAYHSYTELMSHYDQTGMIANDVYGDNIERWYIRGPEGTLTIEPEDDVLLILPLHSISEEARHTMYSEIFSADNIEDVRSDLDSINGVFENLVDDLQNTALETDLPGETDELSTEEDVAEYVMPENAITESYITDLGTGYGGHNQTYTVSIPQNVIKVEVATFGADPTQSNKYGGYNAKMSINGSMAWETVPLNPFTGEDGRNIINHITGENDREPNGRGSFLDITTFVEPGNVIIEYIHYGGGTVGIRVKITTLSN